MTDLRQTIPDQMGGLESLAMKIPGYKGYKEKEMRREADSLLRQHLAAKLSEGLSQAEDLAKQMLTGPGLSQLAELNSGNTRLQTLIDKVKTASQGYSGFFDAIKVKEDELDKLYEFDNQVLANVADLTAALEAIQTALDGGEASTLAPVVRRYGKTVSDLSALFDKRRDVLTGLA